MKIFTRWLVPTVTSRGREMDARWLWNCIIRKKLPRMDTRWTRDGCEVDTRWMQGGREVTLKLYIRKNFCKSSSFAALTSSKLHLFERQNSPCVHTRWLQGVLHDTKSPCVDARWMRGGHKMDMRWTQGRCEMTLKLYMWCSTKPGGSLTPCQHLMSPPMRQTGCFGLYF